MSSKSNWISYSDFQRKAHFQLSKIDQIWFANLSIITYSSPRSIFVNWYLNMKYQGTTHLHLLILFIFWTKKKSRWSPTSLWRSYLSLTNYSTIHSTPFCKNWKQPDKSFRHSINLSNTQSFYHLTKK